MAKRTDALDKTLELAVLLGEDMTQSLARDGLSVPRAKLVWLLHHSGPQTQAALAAGLNVTPRNVTGLVDALVAGGYVERSPHPTDRRALLVSLTSDGASALADMERQHVALARSLFAGMRDLDGFVAGLDHVLARLRVELEAAA
jgi:DNA-binding MarR family transcriptional regulator